MEAEDSEDEVEIGTATNQPYYLNDIVCRRTPCAGFLFGRVGEPLHFKNWTEVREGFSTDFKIYWISETGAEMVVAYPDHAPKKATIVDREIKLGSKVHLNDLSGEVVKTYKVACVQTMGGVKGGAVIWEVNADNLLPLERSFPGRHVFYKNWVGVIESVKRESLLKTEEGYVCSIPVKLKGEPSDHFWDKSFLVPGDQFRLGFFNAVRATWITGNFYTWLSHTASSVVRSVDTLVLGTKVESAKLKWLGLCHSKYTLSECPMPPTTLSNPELSELRYIDYSPSDFVNKDCYRRYNISEIDDEIISFEEWKTRMIRDRVYHTNKRSEPSDKGPKNGGSIVKVLFVRNVINVMWEDGNRSSVYTTQIEKFESPDKGTQTHAHPAFVVYKNEEDEGYGLVKLYDFEHETYRVDWYNICPDNCTKFLEEREIATFDTEAHPIFQKLSQKGQLVIKSNASHLAYFDVGIVVGVFNGKIIVNGADGDEYLCSPTDLALFNFITTWDDETRKWVTEERHDLALTRKESGVGLKRIDSATLVLKKRVKDKGELTSGGKFEVLDKAPVTHHFYKDLGQPNDYPRFIKTVRKEVNIIKDSLPIGIWVKSYEDRMDLFSVMIEGPAQTPYTDHLFLFDVKLPSNYPEVPPLFHFISWSESLNPNLYVGGKICLSLLGTWDGHVEEKWSPESTLFQVLISIQGLILVPEPFFNEPVNSSLRGTDEGSIRSTEYNAKVVLNCLDSTFDIVARPPEPWAPEIATHYFSAIPSINKRLSPLIHSFNNLFPVPKRFVPEFPLLPLTKSYVLAIEQRLARFDDLMALVSKDLDSGKKPETFVADKD